MSVVDVNVRIINLKTWVWYTILLWDVIWSSFIELSFGSTLVGQDNIYQVYVIYIVQLATQAAIMLWFLFMFWSTFLLRFGLIGILIKQFKWTFLYFLLHELLTIAERTFRFSFNLTNRDTAETTIWDEAGYRTVYYLHFLTLLFFYPLMLNFAYRINLPDFYKPTKWLK